MVDTNLHRLLRSRDEISIEQVRELVTANPQVLKERGNFGYLPLHTACRSGRSKEILQYLLQEYPKACSSEDMMRNLPLHHACFNKGATLDALALLVEQYPRALVSKNDYQRIPLQIALQQRCSMEVIEFLVRQFPRGLQVPDQNALLPLHRICLDPNGANVELVRFVAEQYPQALETADAAYRRLPLHFACQERSDLEVVVALVELSPKALSHEDSKGRLPLHAACLNRHHPNLAFISFLVEKYPAALHTADADGRLPLHIACEKHCDADVIFYLAEQYPEAVQRRDTNERLPLHAACENLQHASLAIVSFLTEQFRQALSSVDSQGRLPLHYAACNKVSGFGIVLFLVQQFPQGIKMEDQNGDAPFHSIFYWVREFSSLPWSARHEGDHPENLAERIRQDARTMERWDLMVSVLWYCYFGESQGDKPVPRLYDTCELSHRDFRKQYKWMVPALCTFVILGDRFLTELGCRYTAHAALQKCPHTGNTPLMAALKSIKAWDKVIVSEKAAQHYKTLRDRIMTLVKWNLGALRIRDRQGRLPLACALEAGLPWDIISVMIKEWPISVQEQDEVTGLCMFELAAVSGCNLTSIYSLMRQASPDILAHLVVSRPPDNQS